MHRWLMFRRIIAPQVLRYAIPGLGNIWQLVLKESALISVTGLVELLRQSQIGAGSTRRPFDFYITGRGPLPRHHLGFDLSVPEGRNALDARHPEGFLMDLDSCGETFLRRSSTACR